MGYTVIRIIVSQFSLTLTAMLERNIFCCGVIPAIVCLNEASGAAIQSAFQATGSNETDVTLEGAKDSCVDRCNQRGVDHRYPCQCCTACTKYNDCCADYTDVCHEERRNFSTDTFIPLLVQ